MVVDGAGFCKLTVSERQPLATTQPLRNKLGGFLLGRLHLDALVHEDPQINTEVRWCSIQLCITLTLQRFEGKEQLCVKALPGIYHHIQCRLIHYLSNVLCIFNPLVSYAVHTNILFAWSWPLEKKTRTHAKPHGTSRFLSHVQTARKPKKKKNWATCRLTLSNCIIWQELLINCSTLICFCYKQTWESWEQQCRLCAIPVQRVRQCSFRSLLIRESHTKFPQNLYPGNPSSV